MTAMPKRTRSEPSSPRARRRSIAPGEKASRTSASAGGVAVVMSGLNNGRFGFPAAPPHSGASSVGRSPLPNSAPVIAATISSWEESPIV